jgi:hypothetical protein
MTDDELDALLATLASPGPAPDFADRVMARVAVRHPLAVSRLVAVAAIAIVVLGAMTASVLWTLSHQALLASAGRWFATEASTWALDGVRAVVRSFSAVPGTAVAKKLATRPFQLAAISAFGSLLYATGAIALRHLMTPTSRRWHVSI